MGDPLSVSAAVVGLISLGLSVSSSLIQYYGAYKDSESSIAIMFNSAEALSETFKILNDRFLANSRGSKPLFNSETVDRVEKSIIACAFGVRKLEEKLDRAKGTKPGISSQLRKLQYPFKEKTLEKMQGTIANLRDNLGLALDALQTETASNVLQKVDLIDGKVDSMIARSMNEEEKKILGHLSPLEPYSKQLDVLSRRHEGTGGWLLGSPEFRKWEDGTNKVLWCPGIPGAGKTVLTAVVIDHLQRAKRHEKVGIAYVYCVYNNPHQDLASFMGSLLQQLAQQVPALFQSVNAACQENSHPELGIPISKILQLLHLHVKDFDVVYIVIDALDEYPERNQTRKDLVHDLRSLGPNVHLMVTSRDIPAVEREFQKDVRMDIHAHDEDVASFVKAQIVRDDQLLKLLEDQGSLQDDIVCYLCKKANGMFLLAALHIDALAQEDNVRDLREGLQRLPEAIEATYENTLQRIYSQSSRKAERAKQVLTLIICTMRPLSVNELLWAVTIRPGDTELCKAALPKIDTVLSACCGLVVEDRESGIVRLVHYTAEDYFKRNKTYKNPQSHRNFAGILVTYLNCVEFVTSTGRYLTEDSGIDSFYKIAWLQTLNDHALLRYAAEQWGNHVREAPDPTDEEDWHSNNCTRTNTQTDNERGTWDIKTLVYALLANKSKMVLYSYILWHYDHRHPKFHSPPLCAPDLSIVARFGVTWLVKAFVVRGDDLIRRFLHRTALEVAASYGHLDTVKILYDSGMYQAEATSNALRRAMKGRHLSVTQFLVGQSRAFPKEHDFYAAIRLGDFQIFETLASELPISSKSDFCMGQALVKACCLKDRDDLVRLLLHEDQNWVISKVRRQCALERSAKYGSSDCMSVLLQSNVDVNAVYYASSATALTSCSTVEKAKLLLEAGADPNRWVRPDRTPLGHAIDRCWPDLIRLLVKHGADPERAYFGYTSALEHAVIKGRKKCIKALLELGADPRSYFARRYTRTKQQAAYAIVAKARNKMDSTPFEYFVEQGRPFQVAQLLVSGVDPASCSPSAKRRSEKVEESSYQKALELVLKAQHLHHDKAAYKEFVNGLRCDAYGNCWYEGKNLSSWPYCESNFELSALDKPTLDFPSSRLVHHHVTEASQSTPSHPKLKRPFQRHDIPHS